MGTFDRSGYFTHKESVDLREFLEEKINALEKYIEVKLRGIEVSTKIAADELSRRLEKFPEHFMTKVEYDKSHEKVKTDIERIMADLATKVGLQERMICKEKMDSMNESIASLKAKEGATAKIIAIAVSLTTIVVALIAIVAHEIVTR